MISAKNISKTYIVDITKKVHAVKDISFEVSKGEVFGFLGPNGSGKTTTIKMLLGLTNPNSGEIKINNCSPAKSDIKKIIGYLPENPYFYSHLTGYEVLEFAASLFSIPKNKQKEIIDVLLEKVKMTHAKDKPMKGYSKGMGKMYSTACVEFFFNFDLPVSN